MADNITHRDNGFMKPFTLPEAVKPQLLQLKLSIDNSIMRYLAIKKGTPESDIP